MSKQVLPTEPSPTTTNFTAIGYSDIINIMNIALPQKSINSEHFRPALKLYPRNWSNCRYLPFQPLIIEYLKTNSIMSVLESKQSIGSFELL
jgi:hypothetical protein